MKIIGMAATAAALALLGGGAMAADDTAGIMNTVNGFNDGLNTGKIPTAYMTASQSVVDEFAPHHWSGPGAAKAWWAAFGAFSQKSGMTEPAMKLAKPSRIEQDGAHAYVIVPAVFSFKQKGKPVHEDGALTFAMDHAKGGWKISAFTWSGPRPTP